MAYTAPTPDLAKSSDWSALGKTSDGALYVPGAARIVPPAPSTIWLDAPAGADMDPSRYYVVFEDFLQQASATASAYQTWTAINDGGTGTPAFQDALGGWFNTVTAAADNDYSAYRSVSKVANFESGKKSWYEARFKIAEATTSESTWWFGVCDTTTTGGMRADALGPLASFDGMLIYKTPETALTVNAMVSNAGTQTSSAAFATSISDTVHRCGFYHDGAGFVTPYFHNGTTLTTGGTLSFSYTSMDAMYLIWGVKAGPTAAAETLQIDYIKYVQERS